MNSGAGDNRLPRVSVVIPVYSDNGGVATCVEALQAQDYPAERFEVLLIDNGRNPDFTWIPEQDARFRVIREETPGSYAARNRGIQAAKGEVLAFTDADCLPDRCWISAGVAMLLSDDDCGLVGGCVDLFFADPQSPGTPELYDVAVNLDQENYVRHGKFSVTANMFTRAAMFGQVGLFDQNLRSGGDREWGGRVHAAGYAVAYAAEAVIRHPARSTLAECVTKARRVSGGNVERLRKQGQLRSPGSVLRFLAEGLSPPLTQWRDAAGVRRSLSLRQRMSLFLFMTAMKYLRTAEAVRILFGGEGRR